MNNPKIVLVEDDEMVIKSLSFFLKSKNYDVFDFNNGIDAINYINSNYKNIDLVITDLNLPFAGGKQVIHTIKQIEGASIATIVLTSSGMESTELEMFDLGVDEFMSKPFSPAVLLKRIEKLIPQNT